MPIDPDLLEEIDRIVETRVAPVRARKQEQEEILARLGRVEAALDRSADAQARTDATIAQLAEAQHRTDATIAQLAEAQRRTDATLAQLAEAQARTDATIAQLVEAQHRTDATVAQLADSQHRTEATVAQLVEAQRRTEQELRALAEAQRHTDAQLAELSREVRALVNEGGRQKGKSLEVYYRLKVHAVFGQVVLGTRIIELGELHAALETSLSDLEYADLHRIDLVVAGRPKRRRDVEVCLAVEISGVIDRNDVERAVRRAALLRKIGRKVVPVVAGERLAEDARVEIEARHAAVFEDGSYSNWEAALEAALSA